MKIGGGGHVQRDHLFGNPLWGTSGNAPSPKYYIKNNMTQTIIHNLTYILNWHHKEHNNFKTNFVIDRTNFTLNFHGHSDKSVNNNCCTSREFNLSSTHCHVATSRLLQVFSCNHVGTCDVWQANRNGRKKNKILWYYLSQIFKLTATNLPSMTFIFVEITWSV